jgi:KAP family P-loop domain
MPFQSGLDNPCTDPAEDQFNRWPFSKRLADAIATFDTRDGAPVFGIFGRWGYGKSTVLNYVKRELSTTYSDRVVLFDFNPWLFTTQEELLASFFAGLAAALEASLSGKTNKAAGLLKKYSGAFGMIPMVGGGAAKLAEQLGNEWSANSLATQRERVFEIMRTASRNVVVVIDDLDRLDREEIQTMLKLIRLNANFPRIVYVLAFDDEMVAQAVGARYSGGPEVGREFLQKIVQYPYTLPAVGHDRLVTFVMSQARATCAAVDIKLSDDTWQRFQEVVDKYLSRRLNTPRQTIRYANALHFALSLLKGHVDPFQQMLVEGLRILFPEIYALLRDNARSFTVLDEVYKAVRSLDKEKLTAYAKVAMKGSSPDELDAALNIMEELFKDRASPQSIARPRYFDRYFSYAVAPDDISDEVLRAAIHGAGNEEELSSFFLRMGEGRAERLIDAIYAFGVAYKERDSDRMFILASAVARCGNLFVATPEYLLCTWKDWKDKVHRSLPDLNPLADRAERLILDIVEGASEVESVRSAGMARVLRSAAPPLFAVRLYRTFRRKLKNLTDWRAPEKAVADQIIAIAAADPTAIFRNYSSNPYNFFDKEDPDLDLLSIWNDADEPGQRAWLDARLQGHPADAVPALKFIAHHSGQSRLDFDAWVSAHVLDQAVESHFGAALCSVDGLDSPELALAKRLLAERHRRPGVSGA